MRCLALLILLVTLALALLVLFHTPYLNGADHWQWDWRRVPAGRWYGLMLVAAAPVFAAALLHEHSQQRGRAAVVAAILLLMLGSLTIRLASTAAVRPPAGAGLIVDVVRSRIATSYFIDAGALSNFPGWFSAYDQVLPRTGLHTRSKPPGPLLYWTIFIRAFGYTDRAALIGGVALGVIAMLSIPATWWLARLLTGDRDVAFVAAALLALCPGFELFFPMLDPAYIVLACAMIGVWHLTMTRDSYVLAASFGLFLFIVTMTAYPLLSLGFFLLLHGLLCTSRPWDRAVLVTIRQGAVALGTCAAVYLALWFFTAYNPVATFQSAWANQHRFLAQHEADRVWPATISWDLWDFALGAGWIPVIAAVVFLIRSLRDEADSTHHLRMLVILCVAQPVAVALTGLVQSETARVWDFMLPLLLIPAALELRGWNRTERLTFYACLWLLLAIVGQNMTFVNPG